MTSILTNNAAMAALQTLRTIDANMQGTQARVSSGLRVGGASDNAAYWSIATTMRSDNMALSSIQDALGLGAAKIDTAYAAMESAVEVVKEIKAKLVAATESGVDKTKIQEEITQLQGQLKSIADAASFSGQNWLKANAGIVDVAASFVRDASGSVSVKKVEYTLGSDTLLFGGTSGNTGILDTLNAIDGDGITLYVNTGGVTAPETVRRFTTAEIIATGATFDAGGIIASTTASTGAGVGVGYLKVGNDTWVAALESGAAGTGNQEVFALGGAAPTHAWVIDKSSAPTTGSPSQSVSAFVINALTNEDQLSGLITMVDQALGAMTSAASALGSISMRIGMQEDFVAALTDSIDSGVGRLVDADMNEESTRLKALQTQQQLAIQSLSIANTASESILTLFRQ